MYNNDSDSRNKLQYKNTYGTASVLELTCIIYFGWIGLLSETKLSNVDEKQVQSEHRPFADVFYVDLSLIHAFQYSDGALFCLNWFVNVKNV